MKYRILVMLLLSGIFLGSNAQHVKFTEYNLDNGLHVIFHQDETALVLAVSVMF